MPRHAVTFALMTCLLTSIASAAASPPAAPVAARAGAVTQFDFLIGDWTLKVRPKVSGLVALLHGTPELVGRWTARPQAGGIDDEFMILDASGNVRQQLRAQRRFDASAGRWQVSSTDGQGVRHSSSGAWNGTVMQMSGSGTLPDGTPYQSRVRFFAIRSDAFRWQQDRSTDGGRTWDEATLVIEAQRVPPAARPDVAKAQAP